MHALVRKLVEMDFEYDADEVLGGIHQVIETGDLDIQEELIAAAVSIESEPDAAALALEALVCAKNRDQRHPNVAWALESCLSHPEPAVRFSAVAGAPYFEPAQRLRFLSKIEALLDDPDPSIRRAAKVHVEHYSKDREAPKTAEGRGESQ